MGDIIKGLGIIFLLAAVSPPLFMLVYDFWQGFFKSLP